MVILCIAVPKMGAQSIDKGMSVNLNAKVDALFAEWNKPDSPGCAVGISKNGTLLYEKGYGMASLEWGIPITPAAVFPAASISKRNKRFQEYVSQQSLLRVSKQTVRASPDERNPERIPSKL